MQEQALRAQLEQALGTPVPDRGSAEWPAFVRRVAAERPDLFEAHLEFFTGLSNHAVDEAVPKISDESPDEPYEQQRRRAMARLRRQRLLERLFYRRDVLGRPVLDKRKAILWTMLGLLALLTPMMAGTQSVVKDRQVSQRAPRALASPPDATAPSAPPAPSSPPPAPASEPGRFAQAPDLPGPQPTQSPVQAASSLPSVSPSVAPLSSPGGLPPALPSPSVPAPPTLSPMAGMATDPAFHEPGALTVYTLKVPPMLRQDVSVSAAPARPAAVVYDTLSPQPVPSTQTAAPSPAATPGLEFPKAPGAVGPAASPVATLQEPTASTQPAGPAQSLTLFRGRQDHPLPQPAPAPPPASLALFPAPGDSGAPSAAQPAMLLITGTPAASSSPGTPQGTGRATLVLYQPSGPSTGAVLTGDGHLPTPSAAPGTAPPTAAAGAAKSPYRPGQQLVGHLETRLIVPMLQAKDQQAGAPVVAKTTDGTVWLGTATPGDTNYIQLRFTQAVEPDGTTFSVHAIALSPDGAVGLPPKVEEKTPTLAQDLLRSAIAGVSSYVEAMAQASTIVQSPNGFVSIQQQVPDVKWMVAGEVAKLFKLPQDSRAVVRLGEVPKGTELRILVMDPASS